MDSSQLSQRTISQPMELALNQIIQEIRIFYQPPNGVTAPEEARVWIDRFKRTLASETTDPAELIAAWEEFRRTFTRGFWPIPGAVCQAVRDLRKARREFEPEDRPKLHALPPPPRGKTWGELTDEEKVAHEERTRRVLAELKETSKAMSSPLDALEAKYTRMGPPIAASGIQRNGAGEG